MSKQKTITAKELREKLGMTQFQVAVSAGVSMSTVQRLERSGQWPRQPRVRYAIRRALGLSEVAK